MDLREYLFRKRLSITQFSALVFCNRNYISQIANKKRIPSVRLAKAIEQVTNGDVSAEEVLNPKDDEN